MAIRVKKTKKSRAFMIVFLCLILFSGCGQAGKSETENEEDAEEDMVSVAGEEKLRVVCTIFPVYDWVREILGDQDSGVEVTLLMKSGGDLHNYQPTVMDMAEVANCDLFLYIGGESDAWVEDALKEKKNPDRRAIALLEVLGENAVMEEEINTKIDYVNWETEPAEKHDHKHEQEADEHIWLSLKNTQILVKEIETVLTELMEDVSNISAENISLENISLENISFENINLEIEAEQKKRIAVLHENTESYLEKLQILDAEYEAAIENGEKNTLLFCDRFPFRYFVEDYGLDYYAAFSGCGAETDASFETIAFLSGKVDELGLSAVLVLENSDRKVAETVVRNTKEKNQEILMMDSMQSVGMKELENGENYLSVMEHNLEIVKSALR